MVRAVAIAASIYLVVTHADRLDEWFWAGLLLLVMNTLSVLAQVRARGAAEPVGPVREEGEDVRLVDLLGDPAVAVAWATAPVDWQQVAHLEEDLGPTSARELAEFVWLTVEGDEWSIGLGDEVKPYVDLDTPEEQDAVLQVLRTHPAVAEARHEDRELYVVRTKLPLDQDRFARLAARALASGQNEAARRRR